MLGRERDGKKNGTKRAEADGKNTHTDTQKKKLGHQLIRHNVITPIKARRNPSSPSHFNMISVIAYLTSLQG